MFEKIKKWIKDNKKEILVGAVAVGATAAFFVLKDKKFNSVRAAFSLTLRFFNGPEDKNDWEDYRYINDIYTNVNLNNPGLTVGDLGKLGELLKEKIPSLTDDLQVKHLSSSYSVTRKEKLSK